MEKIMKDIVIVGGCRTAFGSFGGTIRNVLPSDLGAIVIKEALRRTSVKPDEIDEIILGSALQRYDEAHVSRCAALKADIPVEVTSYTVNRNCGSAMQSI